ncbi:flagellar biosynthesis anti-sigma factor FlgM [Deltaproteobacteria bacterium Smac51]|nr:flagellar biosynthesis anti-sigma factor FlgM [Deltaproteobacteria bacterium Smac51]
MKINLNTPYINKETKVTGDPREKAAQNNSEAPRAEEAKNDVVQLSDRSRMAARATELATTAPDVRTDKVEDLRTRINAGTYNISGQTVADSMLRKSITEV